MKQIVFAYGTLKEKAIRKELLGYESESVPATLKGFSLGAIVLDNVEYPIIRENPSSDEIINGEYFVVNENDLEKLDAYESSAYRRILVKLENHQVAWVYIQ
jgi:gamma-glutamylcyclotransferase (GGCT)/AIG2-like uncharacterized protein YtfP